MAAKILFYDIENSPNLSWTWAKYQQDVLKFEREWHLMSVAWKWYGEKKAHVLALPDFEGYEKDRFNDKELCTKLWTLFDEADIVIGHNSNSFDQPKANARFIYHGLGPYSPVKQIDTLKIARRHFKFTCNKLDSLCQHFGIGAKTKHPGMDLWFRCLDGDMKAWDLMKRYNRTDVVILEGLYNKLKPWSDDAVHVGLYEEDPMGKCPCCGSVNLVRRGYKVAATRVYRQYQCKDCGRWSRSVMSEKEVKADIR
jgi:hypothetical protein